MRLHLLLAISVLALLDDCTGLTSHEALKGQGDTQTWRTHKQQLSELDIWQVNGKVGIRVPRDSGSGTLSWLQCQGYYGIHLSGPLGHGAIRLTRREGAVNLKVAGWGRHQAESPEALLEEQLGWRLPASHLSWWVRGLPAPDSKGRLALDAGSHLAYLEQDGWQIEHTRYVEQSGYWLLKCPKLHDQDLSITLVIKDWQPR